MIREEDFARLPVNLDRQKVIEAIQLARKMRERAYVPYSNFPVGAALLSLDGNLYGGCNIENSSFGLTNCAERTALFKALSEGCNRFTLLVLTTLRKDPVTPCGACRQVLSEFASELPILYVNDEEEQVWMDLQVLLPQAFVFTTASTEKTGEKST
ncbi:cytidine deaminase [Heliorestis convoluta]|uniref:Cytidine deaminase n=1 Tax=Heliorestis convoluta TaxID=356322 RepID=A0A5Q2N0P5_9FIRM|nr:cytidine deaminase [Heliorestis convoluta]QGG47891.1 cytidine deaminase [Heliorestis convoluta]